jgi:hypothetical protein
LRLALPATAERRNSFPQHDFDRLLAFENKGDSKDKKKDDENNEEGEENNDDNEENEELLVDSDEDYVEELAGDYNYVFYDDDEEYGDGIDDYDGK